MRETGNRRGAYARRIRAGLALGATTAALSLLAAGSAGATVTFGADLTKPADLSFHCNVPPPFFGPYRPPSPYAFPDTCTALTAGNFGGGGMGSMLVPNGSGVITKIRIKEPPASYDSAVGSTFGPAGPLGQSGPLKISVLQALRQAQSSTAVCCTVAAESAPFTPLMQASVETVTEVTLTPPLPVHAIVTATGVYEFQGIAISAVQADSVIPAGRSSTASSGGYYPAVQPGQERFEQQTSFGSADTVNTGTQIMVQADWEPTITPPTGQPPAGPLITVPKQTDRVKGGLTAINLRCEQTAAPCIGQLKLQSRRAVGARAASRAVTVTYGTGTINVPARSSRGVKVRLSGAGRRLLRRHKRATVFVNVTLGGTLVSSVAVALRR